MKELKKEISLPKTIWGKDLPSKLTKKDKYFRMKYYFKDSIIFTIFMTLFDIIAILVSPTQGVFAFTQNYYFNFVMSVFIVVIILFVISFTFDYLVGERKVKKYNNIK